MNYEPNFTQWEVGDLVSHDCDSKSVEYLMKVVAVLPLGLYECTYPNRKPDLKGSYVNHGSVLHNPEEFGIDLVAGIVHQGVKKPLYEVWAASNPVQATECRTERRLAYDFTNTDEFKLLMKKQKRTARP